MHFFTLLLVGLFFGTLLLVAFNMATKGPKTIKIHTHIDRSTNLLVLSRELDMEGHLF